MRDERKVSMPCKTGRETDSETGIKLTALLVAVVLHAGVLLVNLPEVRERMAPPRAPQRPIVVKKYVPPPPRVERRSYRKSQKLTRKVPIPDPTPEQPEPIREARIEVEPEPFALEGDEILIGSPLPPSGAGRASGVAEPLLAGVGGVTLPVRIEESYIQPDYPELARLGRVEANVIVQAVIRHDGTVGEVEVLRCTRAGFGFEQSAVEAITRWRYTPATQCGTPVDVYFTILVEFSLV